MAVLDPGPTWVLLVEEYAPQLGVELADYLGRGRVTAVEVLASEARHAVLVTVTSLAAGQAAGQAEREAIARLLKLALRPAWKGVLMEAEVGLWVDVDGLTSRWTAGQVNPAY